MIFAKWTTSWIEIISSCEANDSWPKIRSGPSMDEKIITERNVSKRNSSCDINNAMDSNAYLSSENANQCNT